MDALDLKKLLLIVLIFNIIIKSNLLLLHFRLIIKLLNFNPHL